MRTVHTIAKVIKFEVADLARSRWLLAYVLFFAIVCDALLRFNGAHQRALLGLVNIVLLVVPLVAVAFGSVHLYARRDFIELLLAQPVRRRAAYAALYLGLTIPLMAGMVVGLVLAATVHGVWSTGLGGTLMTLILTGLALTGVFVAIAFCVAVRCEDRVKGLAIGIALWLIFAVLYDGMVLLLASMYADYPVERALLGAMVANPIDLARVVLLLQFDISALMGYTGAVLRDVFGSVRGLVLAGAALSLWIALPVWLGGRAFVRKDF